MRDLPPTPSARRWANVFYCGLAVTHFRKLIAFRWRRKSTKKLTLVPDCVSPPLQRRSPTPGEGLLQAQRRGEEARSQAQEEGCEEGREEGEEESRQEKGGQEARCEEDKDDDQEGRPEEACGEEDRHEEEARRQEGVHP